MTSLKKMVAAAGLGLSFAGAGCLMNPASAMPVDTGAQTAATAVQHVQYYPYGYGYGYPCVYPYRCGYGYWGPRYGYWGGRGWGGRGFYGHGGGFGGHGGHR